MGCGVGYSSADEMLERYLFLLSSLVSPNPAPLPDLFRLPSPVNYAPGSTPADWHRAELSDIGLCLRRARLQPKERYVMQALYRPRRQYCRACRRVFPRCGDRPRCPRCNRSRAQGWSYEPLPTAQVLADEMTKRRVGNIKWTPAAVRRTRDSAYY